MASYPSIQPAQAPVQSSSAYHTPKPGPPYASAQTTPPSWQRKEEEDSGPPAWGNTLKATGIKPWDADVSYSNEQQPLRSVPYNSTPAKSPVSPGQFSPSGAPQVGGSENGPKVVHLQYNSPMYLYSNQNVAETLKGQTQALSGQTKPNIAATNESGERDWSQSAVLKFITQEDTKKGKQPPLPAVAPKPQFYPVQPSRSPQPFYQPVDASEF
uniref:Zasp-like motif domain-containing protein n=2 Tax=Arion vulgaris TaxID=1028688 RepID=A0A0B7BGY9_9EUPU